MQTREARFVLAFAPNAAHEPGDGPCSSHRAEDAKSVSGEGVHRLAIHRRTYRRETRSESSLKKPETGSTWILGFWGTCTPRRCWSTQPSRCCSWQDSRNSLHSCKSGVGVRTLLPVLVRNVGCKSSERTLLSHLPGIYPLSWSL